MSKWRCGLVAFVAFVLGLSLLVPAEDVAETAYDESEAMPYEITPNLSLAVLRGPEVPALCRCASRPSRSGLVRSTLRSAHKKDSSARIFHSLTILDHSFRC